MALEAIFVTVLTITKAVAAAGFLLNLTVFYFALMRGRRAHHYMFAGILLICALWDLGILIAMQRNAHPRELVLIGYLVSIACIFMLPLIFHFTCSYLARPWVKTSLLLWIIAAEVALLMAAGKFGRIIGIYEYSWGNFWRGDESWRIVTLIGIGVYIGIIFTACGMLAAQMRREKAGVMRRKQRNILASFLLLALAAARVLPVLGVGLPGLLPFAMVIHDAFMALIGITILDQQVAKSRAQTNTISQL